MTFKDNPDYEIAHSVMHEGKQVDFFVPVDKTNGYHLSRKIAGDAQDSIARLGATVETFETDIDKVNELLNQDGLKNEKRIENAASYLKWIKYRLKHPKNEECALRMAAIFLFIEGENPDKPIPHITEKKVNIAFANPETYTFFLTIGESLMKSWQTFTESIKDEDYLMTRAKMMRILTME